MNVNDISPVGYIDPNYPHYQLLLKEARIGFREERKEYQTTVTVKRRDTSTGKTIEVPERIKKTLSSKCWYIVPDKTLVPTTYRLSSGTVKKDFNRMKKSLWGHIRFCAILSYVLYECEKQLEQVGKKARVENARVFDLLVGKSDVVDLPGDVQINLGANVKKMKEMDKETLYSTLGKAGMQDYVDGITSSEGIRHPDYGKPKKDPLPF